MGSSSDFLLGVDYSEWLNEVLDSPQSLNGGSPQIATDSSGALYILATCSFTGSYYPSCVTKLSADGTTILWQNTLGFAAIAMAVDPSGGVYVIPSRLGELSVSVEKLGAGGKGVAWSTPTGLSVPAGWNVYLAVDPQGRAYVAVPDYLIDTRTDVARLKADGSSIDYSAHVTGTVISLAVDRSGAAFISGNTFAGYSAGGFLARLAPDGSVGFYSTGASGPVAVDSNGNAVMYSYSSGALLRYNPTGSVILSTPIPGPVSASVVVDSSGNAYITGLANGLYPVRNSIMTCESAWLSVVAPDGSVLQTTYVPGASTASVVATTGHSTVFVLAWPDNSFRPTQAGPFPAGGFELMRLSPNANAQVFPLVCQGNSATYQTVRIAPGEMVTLFGSGLGPVQGIQTQATSQTAFPTQAGNVEVTFDGNPAPLLWVQDRQINVIAPWSLTPGQPSNICVINNGVTTNCQRWPVTQASPGVFTVDGVHAAALNQDGTVNSKDHPAPVGSVITVFATGLGPITPPQADGALVGLPLPSNVLPVKIFASAPSWGGVGTSTQFNVTYAGPAPDLVAGVSQISFQVVAYEGQISLYLSYYAGSNGFQIYVAGQ